MEEDEKIEELLPEAEFKGEDLRAVYEDVYKRQWLSSARGDILFFAWSFFTSKYC